MHALQSTVQGKEACAITSQTRSKSSTDGGNPPQNSITMSPLNTSDRIGTSDAPMTLADTLMGPRAPTSAMGSDKKGNVDFQSSDAAYPPSARANDKRRYGDSSRGSSNNKRTSLLASATPPSTTKKNEAALSGATTLRRLVTPPIVARAMRDTPSSLQQQQQQQLTKSAQMSNENTSTAKDPSKLGDEYIAARTLVSPATNSKEEGMMPLDKADEDVMKNSSQQEADEGADIFSWTDAQLAQHYVFEKEIGFGNWGSVWLATPRKAKGAKTAFLRAQVAIKLVHRQGTPASNARVKAIWNETKILRSCGKPVHPNLVNFKEFVITPSYALVVMDYYRQPMNVALPMSMYAGPDGYFHQLLDSINWLHTRNVTHCDIKVANLLVDTRQDKLKGRPILVDFGFATLHDGKTKFMSNQSWGTPEYLSPERNRGDHHDERLSDIWALGVTFFEIATGRTPFEHEDEQFLTKEQLDVYYKRTLESEWVGSWTIPDELESLCRYMLAADPKKRIYCDAALAHPFFIHHILPSTVGDIDESLMREFESGRTFVPTESLSPEVSQMPVAEPERKFPDKGSTQGTPEKTTNKSTYDQIAQIKPQAPLAKSPRKDDEKPFVIEATVDAELTRSDRSADSDLADSSSVTGSAIRMLKSSFRRNKKRVAVYPPSAFSSVIKQHCGATNTSRFSLSRRSSEGTMATMKEHVEKKKNLSAQESGTSMQQKMQKGLDKAKAIADLSQSGKDETSDAVLTRDAQVSKETSTLIDERSSDEIVGSAVDHFRCKAQKEQSDKPKDQDGTLRAQSREAAPENSFQSHKDAEVKSADLVLLQSTSAVRSPPSTASRQASLKRKALPQLDDHTPQSSSTNQLAPQEAKGSFRPSLPPKASTKVVTPEDEGVVGEQAAIDHFCERASAYSNTKDVGTDELARRLTDLTNMTSKLVQMVQETQLALQKMQGIAPAKTLASSSPEQSLSQARKSMYATVADGQVQLRAQSPFHSMFSTSEVMPRSSIIASPQHEAESHRTDLGVRSAVLASQASWQLSAVDKMRQVQAATGTVSVDPIHFRLAQGNASVDAVNHRQSYVPNSAAYSKQSRLGQGAQKNAHQQHFFDDGSHEDLGSSEEVRTLRHQMGQHDQQPAPSSSTPLRQSSLTSHQKSPSESGQRPAAIVWPAVTGSRAGASSVDVPQVTNSRLYQSNFKVYEVTATPTGTNAPTKVDGRFRLSKVKSFTIGRSNSFANGGVGRFFHASPTSSGQQQQQKRNTLVNMQWDDKADESEKVFVITSNEGANGGFLRGRLASFSSLNHRRPSFSSTISAARQALSRTGSSADRGSRVEEASPKKVGTAGSTFSRRSSLVRRRPTPTPPASAHRQGTAQGLEVDPGTDESATVHPSKNAETASMPTPSPALWRVLASKVQARRL